MSQPDLLLSLERAARELRDFTAPVFTSPHKDEVITLGLIQQAADALDLARAEIQSYQKIMAEYKVSDDALQAAINSLRPATGFADEARVLAAAGTFLRLRRAAATDALQQDADK